MKTQSILALIAFMSCRETLFADQPATPMPWVTTSEFGGFLFKMVPEKGHLVGDKFVVDREAFGVAYEINQEGEFIETWRTKGWHTFNGHLSRDGRYFVRIGPWASDQKDHKDLAIAFYDRGKLLKEYQVRELIKKPELIIESVSHYQWSPQKQTEPDGFKERGRTFHLVMIHKTEYSFEVATGEIVTTGTDTNARSPREIHEQEEAAANKRGKTLFEKCPFRQEFEDHFQLSNVQAEHGWVSGVGFEGPQWTADLTPKKKYPFPCEVAVAFPIAESGEIKASITPDEIDAAFMTAFSHPFIHQRFKKSGATGLRLRINGDGLHWDTQELRGFLTKLTGIEPKADGLRDWASLTVDAEEPRYISVYLNTKTKELIYADESKWPLEPILLDGNGTQTNVKKPPPTTSVPPLPDISR